MRHVAAYMMLVLGGNKAPTADDVKNVLSAAGIEADDTQLTRLIDALANKNIDEIVEAGSKKLAAMGGGGGGGGGAGAGAGAGAGEGGDAAAEDDDDSSSAGGDGGGAADLFGGSDSDDDDDDSDSSE